MVRAFWQSRLAVAVFGVAASVLGVAVWVHDRGKPLYIPLTAIVLLAVLCMFAGQMAGRIIAGSVNTRCLSLLHVQLDPQAFLRAYEGVPGRLKEGSREYALACAYLAEGYAAAGEFDRAMDTLRSGFAGEGGEDLTLKGLYFHTMASCALSGENLPRAEEAVAGLEQAAADSRESNPGLAQSMEESLTLCRNRLAALKGEPVDTAWLEERLKRTPFALRRLEILQTLARQAAAEGRREEALSRLEQMERQAGKTFFRGWAERARQVLDRDGL